MSLNRPLVTLMGKKDGFVLVLDDTCAFDALLEELKQKLSQNQTRYREGPTITVKVQAGDRYLKPEQRDELTRVISSFHHLKVAAIESNVMTQKEFEEKRVREQLVSVNRVIRSGQVLSIQGNLLLIGDVNPGGTVTATGNIYVFGALRGIACAGTGDSNPQAVIAASIMEPTQLRIGDRISRTDESQLDELRNDHFLECAYVDPDVDKIVIDKLHQIQQKQIIPVMNADM
ncbi:septum site-determining protein MinC [Sporolactobacillus vineae]|uniref:septum site-determining protein MinC n=1 Tax=Sporolactobacillus vineae TaxID=444463 RepID=UPI0002891F7A|nr:septum site-determining protein MinC [Sporolactobacillus vineae]